MAYTPQRIDVWESGAAAAESPTGPLFALVRLEGQNTELLSVHDQRQTADAAFCNSEERGRCVVLCQCVRGEYVPIKSAGVALRDLDDMRRSWISRAIYGLWVNDRRGQ